MNLGQAIGILCVGVKRERPPTAGAKLVVTMCRERYPDWVRSIEISTALAMEPTNCCNRLQHMHGRGFLERRGTRGRYEYRWKAPSVLG